MESDLSRADPRLDYQLVELLGEGYERANSNVAIPDGCVYSN